MGRVVIIGGGFAGLAAARGLEDRHQVTLIDRTRWFEFLPNIHEIVSNLKTPKGVRIEREKLAKDLRQTFVQDELVGIDPAARKVDLQKSTQTYDALIVAIGSEPSGGGGPHAVTFRSVADARIVRDRLTDLSKIKRPSTITIVGGGATGIEVLGEMLRDHKKSKRLSFRLIESSDRLVSGWPRLIHKQLKKLLARYNVDVRFNERVEAVSLESIRISSGVELPSHLTVWTAGINLPTRAEAFTRVDDTLASIDHPGIFVAGDAATTARGVPKQAAEALAMGERAAQNVRRFLKGRELRRFRRTRGPRLLMFGDLDCFVAFEDGEVIGGAHLRVGRELVFQRTMAQLEPDGRWGVPRHAASRFFDVLSELPWQSLLDPRRLFDYRYRSR